MAFEKPELSHLKIGVVGLGYVGLPLAVEFGQKVDTVGFDVKQQRIEQLEAGIDVTDEADKGQLESAVKLRFCSKPEGIKDCNFMIVTVPTPVDDSKRPDLSPLVSASRMIGSVLKPNDIVVYESTVYPGATEEVCVPILEKESGLKFNQDFFVGYSPERINPGDKTHRLPNIVKVTSGSTPEVASFVDEVYGAIIVAGTHLAPSIAVAEAAKVIENTQRDLNIALVNELAIIFNRLGIDTQAVLEAAGTKWNFLKFSPGLVGGHCIGVDPYYLTFRAQQIGYLPEVILAGRRINDGMGEYVVSRVVRLMIQSKIHVAASRVLVMGIAFKENCGDIRNSRVIDIVKEAESYGATVDVFDPLVDAAEVKHEYGLDLIEQPSAANYDAIIAAVAHDDFKSMSVDQVRQWGKKDHILFEVKDLFGVDAVDGRL